MKYFLGILLLLQSLQAMIKISYTEIENEYYIEMKIGIPPQAILCKIDQTLHFSLITSTIYNSNSSKSNEIISKIPIILNGIVYYVTEMSDQVYFLNNTSQIEDINIPNFVYYYLEEHKRPLDSVFGFGFNFYFEGNSFIHLLEKHNIIENLSFSIVTLNELKDGGHYYFGGIPTEEIAGYTNSSIEMSVPSTSWSCIVNQTKILNITYNNVHKAIFQAGIDKIYLPESLFKYIADNMFYDYIEEEVCMVDKTNTYKYFKCLCSVKSRIPDSITFTFNEINVTLNTTKLFKTLDSGICMFYMVRGITTDLKSEIIFGMAFMHQFKTLFDYQNKKITLYYNNIREQGGEWSINNINQKNSITKKVILIMSTILIVFTIWISFVKIKIRHHH